MSSKYLIEPWARLRKEGYCETVLAYFLDEVRQPSCLVAFHFHGETIKPWLRSRRHAKVGLFS